MDPSPDTYEGTAMAQPDPLDTPPFAPESDRYQGRPPLRWTRSTKVESPAVQPLASVVTAEEMPKAAARRATRAPVVVAARRYAVAWLASVGNGALTRYSVRPGAGYKAIAAPAPRAAENDGRGARFVVDVRAAQLDAVRAAVITNSLAVVRIIRYDSRRPLSVRAIAAQYGDRAVDVADSDRLTLAPVTSSPAAARRWVEAQLAGSREELAETAALLTGELVTNSVLHAQTDVEIRIERRGDHIRIRVADGNSVIPTIRRYGTYAGTGRGLTLVESLAAAWGCEPTPRGKVVFFDLAVASGEVGGDPSEAPGPPMQFDLDSWPDLEDIAPAVSVDLVDVALIGVPLPILQRATEQYDTLAREFALIVDPLLGEPPDVPARLLALMDELSGRFGAFTDSTNAKLDAAIERGDETMDLTYRLPPDVGPATLQYDALLDEADAFCKAGALLTLAAAEETVALRKWFLLEFVAQAAGRPPTPWPASPWALSLHKPATSRPPEA